MEKTTRTLLTLLVISGLVFSACSSEPVEELNVLEPEVEDVMEIEEEEVVADEEPEIIEETDEFIPTEPEPEAPVEEAPVEEGPEEAVEENETILEENTVEEEAVEVSEMKYANGTYTKTGLYNSPAGEEAMTFLFLIQDDFLYSTTAIVSSQNTTSQKFQQLFADGIASYTNGVKLDEVESVSALNGSSLTPDAFNQALAALKSSALN